MEKGAVKKIAVIQFPGSNCEYETAEAVRAAGLSARIFRWNRAPELLPDFDGFVIPGGFSYQDRVRAGAAAAKKKIMKVVFGEALQGKPVLGICNGAQILIESGILPGIEPGKVEMALAPNTGRAGYYCGWVYMLLSAPPGKCAFTLELQKEAILPIPVAHAEGRFTAGETNLIKKLRDNGQVVFRYCSFSGLTSQGFPVNPNGSVDNIAGICNPEGNVLGLMPHPERAAFIRQVPDVIEGDYGRIKLDAYGKIGKMSSPGPGMGIFLSMAAFLKEKTGA